MIEIRIDEVLRDQGRTFYWLAKQTGISHTTLWRLKKGKALGINFETLEKLCKTLVCQPSDILSLGTSRKSTKSTKVRATKPARSSPPKVKSRVQSPR